MNRIQKAAAGLLAVSLLAVSPVSAARQSYLYDNRGNSIPAPLAYALEAVYSGQSLGLESLESPEDLFVAPSGDLYIVDKERAAITQVSPSFELKRDIRGYRDGGEEQPFSEPSGVFVDGQGVLYVADAGSHRILKLDAQGNLLRAFERPETDLLDENAEFRPVKVVVDDIGNVYAVGYGLYQGFVKYDKEGRFEGFFGGNKVEVTPELVLRQFWKKLFTDEQAQATSRSLPVEYSNAAIDADGFIYAVVMQTSTSLDEVRKLNAQGKNVLRYAEIGTHYARNDFGDIEKDYTATTTYKDNRMVDVAAGGDGTMALLDGERGHVFVYDQDCNLLFTFGQKGDERGDFSQPVSIARMGERYLVADAVKKCVMVYRPTAYAGQVLEAMTYYTDGKYVESAALWKAVLRRNAGSLIAYKSLGKASLQQGDYRQAMEYFRYADDKEGYSDAYAEYRKAFVREHIAVLLPAAVAACVLVVWLLRRLRKWFGFSTRKAKTTFR